MNKYILTPLVAALTVALTACGGSSSNSDNTTPTTPGSNGGNSNQAQTISLQALSYQCEIDTPYQADIVFHNQDGNSIGSAKTDEQGLFSGELPTGTKHLSVLGDVTDYQQEEYTQILTELDIENRNNLGKFYFENYNQNCGCEEYRVDTINLGDIAAYYKVYKAGNELTDTVYICPGEEKLYLTAITESAVEAKAAVIAIPQDSKVIKLTEADFSHEGVEVAVQQTQENGYSSTRGYIEEASKYQFVQFVSFSGDDSLFVFPTVTEHNFYVQVNSQKSNANNVEVSFNSYARSSVNADGSYIPTDLPEISSGLGFDLMQFANDSQLNFDFSNVDERFARARWGYSFLVSDAAETRFDWDISGGVSGQIPNLSFGSVFPEPVDQVVLEELTLLLYGYGGNATDAQSYAKLLDTIAEGGHITKPEFSNYVYLFMSAQLD
ncbi:hypothetical protein HJP15_02770 [Pseudoalteromonas sp. NEC-BIFX-2020_002]|uniref:Lipoprotein n=1 Tax=Pseudoalteromonas porphyrae TaxID=187330 RepID=A0A0N1EYB2_9GAMM|nr:MULTISPECIES: hypothetical protein [Pseudoalteromonas]KPH63780.1 hypothetical protein ADS77_07630 [Pseudoalteromonas porphyrae]NNG41874.1 hypothetical protein [Pseudoalteromonas sp. NEC-BIFX-2020_002]